MGFIKSIIKSLYYRLFNEEITAQNTEISNLKADIERLKVRKQIDFPETLGIITIKDIYPILKSICSEVYISDEWFNITSQEEYQRFSEETATQYRTWVQDQHDCDNFSFELMGYFSQGLMSFAFGICWSATHAFNICLTNTKEIFIVEPQTNKYIPLEEAKKDSKYYPLRLICM